MEKSKNLVGLQSVHSVLG